VNTELQNSTENLNEIEHESKNHESIKPKQVIRKKVPANAGKKMRGSVEDPNLKLTQTEQFRNLKHIQNEANSYLMQSQLD